jgi:hypothetical protein
MEGLDGAFTLGRPCNADAYLLWPMKCTKLVAVWVSHICQVQGTEFAFTQAWRFFNRSTSMSNGCVMELLHLLWRSALESDRASIGEGCGLTVDWFADAKRPAIVPIEQARLPRVVLISQRFSCPEYAEQGVIEAL